MVTMEGWAWLAVWHSEALDAPRGRWSFADVACCFGGDRLYCLRPEDNEGLSGAAVSRNDAGDVVAVASFGLRGEFGGPQVVGVLGPPAAAAEALAAAVLALTPHLAPGQRVLFQAVLPDEVAALAGLPKDVRDLVEAQVHLPVSEVAG